MVDNEAAVTESSKSRLIALLLCFMFGWMGAHRFYAKKIGTGIAMLLTMGGFGLWVFYDIILILVGKFRDADDVCITSWNMNM
ncbi:MAG: TM2 domain-containing protein [Candidatus Magnetobacterium sp. LHC-1]|uniref:TM2 domain-containing protein n=1 Tax=Candidatus Magnetobacterium casense TaxID=1455061 RepID=A0ABS6S1H4_9BACT|nr:TM2 domain-containing protein [Candidatus Magnetobacterium casensis]MBF0608726.1 TM2 domain-containing protein [Nitrospirota bacterium]MBV6342249.1 TM2 domain-containing protein [Candidatus Magnetobacterium casensis]